MISLRVEIPNARELSPPCHPISILADEVCGCAQEWRAEERGGVTRYNYQTRRGSKSFPEIVRVPSAGLAATPKVRSMAPSKRRKTSAVSQPSSDNASAGVRTRRSTSARGDLPDAPDADLDAEPEVLMCPITRTIFRDPVFVFDSGHTYERSAILSHFERNGAKDPLTRRALSSTKVKTNWAMRNVVQDWVDKHPGVTPDGWDSRELLEPSKDDGTRTLADEGDVGVLRTWRAMCPALQELWLEDEQPEDWHGVEMENGRVVKLVLEQFGLTGALPAEVGRLSALKVLWLHYNQLTSLPAEIGQLTSLEELNLEEHRLRTLPAAIGELAVRGCVVVLMKADERVG